MAVITGRWRATHPCREELAALKPPGRRFSHPGVTMGPPNGPPRGLKPDVPAHAGVASPLYVLMGGEWRKKEKKKNTQRRE